MIRSSSVPREGPATPVTGYDAPLYGPGQPRPAASVHPYPTRITDLPQMASAVDYSAAPHSPGPEQQLLGESYQAALADFHQAQSRLQESRIQLQHYQRAGSTASSPPLYAASPPLPGETGSPPFHSASTRLRPPPMDDPLPGSLGPPRLKRARGSRDDGFALAYLPVMALKRVRPLETDGAYHVAMVDPQFLETRVTTLSRPPPSRSYSETLSRPQPPPGPPRRRQRPAGTPRMLKKQAWVADQIRHRIAVRRTQREAGRTPPAILGPDVATIQATQATQTPSGPPALGDPCSPPQTLPIPPTLEDPHSPFGEFATAYHDPRDEELDQLRREVGRSALHPASEETPHRPLKEETASALIGMTDCDQRVDSGEPPDDDCAIMSV